MKKAVITLLAISFSISLCMSQNIQQQRQIEAQRQQQATEQQRQQQLTIQQERQREVERQRRLANSHRVTFNRNGGSVVEPQMVYNGERASKPIDPTMANWAFVEWRKEGESTPFDFNTPITDPITLSAIWVSLLPTVTTTSEGTLIRESTLSRKLDWLERNVESHNTYIVEVNANENIAPRTLEYRGAINVTIILRGDHVNRTIRLQSHGTMFTVNPNITFVLDNNITLHGHRGNTNNSVVFVNNGTFIMKTGATITGNLSNTCGGAVCVDRSGTFEMRGGTISANTGSEGGGVNVHGTFTMSGGVITDNTASRAGGVNVQWGGTFTMTGGVISENNARGSGGGVRVAGGTFTMRGGTITSNAATEYGGGVFIEQGNFVKTNGTITGFNSDRDNGNVVKDHSGTLARRGHAVYVNHVYIRLNPNTWDYHNGAVRRETTAGATVNLSTESINNWDQ
ncbi:MAG: InlB B-repeat-containing protein [Bacteroidales bacterium]|jgi:hypothetical protein|nr:InlB B-repeat-containing protein [Bacteroidales bacterium]